MPLNLEPRSSADFTPYLKFNGKAGRWYIRTDTGEDKEILGLTAIFDLATIKTGWIHFVEGAAPDMVWDDDGTTVPAPSRDHRRGFAVNVFSPRQLGGLREFSSTSNGAIIAMKELYAEYEKQSAGIQQDPQKQPVPVVTCESVEAVKSKFGTNYQPVLKITKWVPRPHEMRDAAPVATAFDADEDDLPLPPPSSARPQSQAAVDEF
jgi:hypothetical protein